MSETTDFSALEWVKGEIGESLKQAQHALEAYAANPKDSTKMQFCIMHLHQVWGTLQMVELDGATLFAEEMEALAQAILDKKVPKLNEANEVLIRAFIQLPAYIDNIASGSKDLPVVLVPVLNDLRSTRGENLVSETGMFSPDLASGEKVSEQRKTGEKVSDADAQYVKLRKAYQKALVSVIQGKDLEKSLEFLSKVLVRLQQLSGKSSVSQLWWMSGAMIDGLLNGSIELSSAVKGLLGAVDRKLKDLVEDNEKVLAGELPEDLAKNILYYVASSEATTNRIKNVQKAYRLNKALPQSVKKEQSQQALKGVVKEAISIAVEAVVEDLLNAKDSLDLVVRSKTGDLSQLEELLPVIQRSSSALHLIGLKSVRETIDQQEKIIQACLRGEVEDIKQGLMSVAGELLSVESSLKAISAAGGSGKTNVIADTFENKAVSSEQLGAAQHALLQETVSSLEIVKDLFAALIASGWEKTLLPEAVEILSSLSGSLKIIPLPLASEMLFHCSQYIQEQLVAPEVVPEQKQLEVFANVVSSIEYYIEKLLVDSRADDLALLVGCESLAELGYQIDVKQFTDQEILSEKEGKAGEVVEPKSEVESKEKSEVETKEKAGAEAKEKAGVEAKEKVDTEAKEKAEVEAKEKADAEAKEKSEVEAKEKADTEAKEKAEVEAKEKADTEAKEKAEVEAKEKADTEAKEKAEVEAKEKADTEAKEKAETEVKEKAAAEAKEKAEAKEHAEVTERIKAKEQDDDSIIDDEIIEIFVEEVEEVQETLSEYLPQWQADLSNEASLTEVRRAFHTLKGSGRLVGANALGEMAWSVESMLNRILDKSIQPTDAVLSTISEAVGIVPSLLELFKQGKDEPTDESTLLEKKAEALANGESAELAEETSAFDDSEYDEEIVEIFSQEAKTHLKALSEFISGTSSESGPWVISDDVLRSLHTLKGCANMAAIEPIAPVVTKTENFTKELRLQDRKANDQVIAIIGLMISFTHQVINELPKVSAQSHAMAEGLLEELEKLSEVMLTGDAPEETEGDSGKQARIDKFLTFAFDQIFDGEDYLNACQEKQDAGEDLKDIQKSLKGVADELLQIVSLAHECELEDIEELCSTLKNAYLVVSHQTIDPVFYKTLGNGTARVIETVDFLAAGQFTKSPSKIIAKLQAHVDEFQLSEMEDLEPLSAQVADANEPVELEALATLEVEDDGVELAAESELLIDVDSGIESTLVSPDEIELDVEDEIQNITIEDAALGLVEEGGLSDDIESIDSINVEPEMEADIDRDPEIVEIFLEEAEELLENSSNILEQWSSERENLKLVAELQRDLHTLKGGARMAEFASVGDLGHELENLYEGVCTGGLDASDEMFSLLFKCQDRLSEMVSDIQAQGTCARANELVADIKVLASGESLDSVSEIESITLTDETSELELLSSDQVALEGDGSSEEILDTEIILSAETASVEIEEPLVGEESSVGEESLASEEPLAEDKPLADKESLASEEPLASELPPVIELEITEDSSVAIVEELSVVSEIDPATSEKLLEDDEDSELDVDLELVEIFLEEAEEIIESSSNALEQWRSDRDNIAFVEQLQRELHTLKGGARMAQSVEIGDFSHELENLYEAIVNKTTEASDKVFDLLLACQDRLTEMVVELRSDNSCAPADALLAQVKLAIVGQLGDFAKDIAEEASKEAVDVSIVLEANIDTDVLDIFLRDGVDIISEFEGGLKKVKKLPGDSKLLEPLRQQLVNLKGGATLAGLNSLGSFCGQFDHLIREAESPSASVSNLEVLNQLFAKIKLFELELQGERDKRLQVEGSKAKPASAPKAAGSVKKAAAKTKPDKKEENKKTSTQQESIKVSAGLLETLVNLAGETSINRGRIEVQLSDFSFQLDEMTDTIERLEEQLRRLHLETEAQILFSHETDRQKTQEDEDFDPLEMDRYSALDQLSRSLQESASDLLDLKDTLSDNVRDTETLLLQQSRINTELQEGLMRSRMVPFTRLVPRLRRIVRQVGNELKKPVDLEISGAEGELDRAVLERMISPIEHMLRNSIAHGIENAADRKKAGKVPNGTIKINLGREGSSMLITLSDDGAGVNVAAVKKKAIANGLLDPNANLSDNEIVEFIFNPGFSTADTVSQVAGRGVGMDVVSSEIKQLGGTIDTDSITGQGTSFGVRLPFTVAVNRALMVKIGEDSYAIPLSNIEGVVRVSPYELEAYYEQEEAIFQYAGVDYELQYLGGYMHGHERPHLLGQTKPLPVLLVRTSEHTVALQVDLLLGSREVVVKSVGPQLSTVAGISGATILGDGSVVIILDIHSLIRGAIAQKESAVHQADAIGARVEEKRALKVMVVDDSVTVRKVTSRLLERNGMEVLLAKDGVDAITQLQEVKPDIMLLDIEMPRMDGFEVATLVRHDDRLKDLPIIMITSRTGEKHKERAISIGVNKYLGKPFQEKILLDTIAELNETPKVEA